MFSLEGKVVVVTGGGSGIGRVTARRFAAAGARVAVLDLAAAEAVAAEIGGIGLEVDVADDAAMQRAMEAVGKRWERIDVVVNNAGIALGEQDRDIEHLSDDVARRLFEVNALGVSHGMKHALPWMPDGGSIVNCASLAGEIGFPDFPAYHMSKAAVVGLTRSASLQLAPRSIRVNAVCPGIADTPMTWAEPVDYEVFTQKAVPLARLATPEDIAAAIHFLASDDSSFITGQAIYVGGGISVGLSTAVVDWALEAG